MIFFESHARYSHVCYFINFIFPCSFESIYLFVQVPTTSFDGSPCYQDLSGITSTTPLSAMMRTAVPPAFHVAIVRAFPALSSTTPAAPRTSPYFGTRVEQLAPHVLAQIARDPSQSTTEKYFAIVCATTKIF